MKAKYISLGILIALVVLGVVVLFFTEIPMDRYVQLAKVISTTLLPLFISIGTNSIVEKICLKKGDEEKGTSSCVEKTVDKN